MELNFLFLLIVVGAIIFIRVSNFKYWDKLKSKSQDGTLESDEVLKYFGINWRAFIMLLALIYVVYLIFST